MGPELTSGRMPLPSMQSQSQTKAIQAISKMPSEQNATGNPHLAQQAASLKMDKFVARTATVDKDNVNRSLPKEPDQKVTTPALKPPPPAEKELTMPLKALAVFNDQDSGQVVSIARDITSGKEIQIPDQQVLERYKIVEAQRKAEIQANLQANKNIEAQLVQDKVSVDRMI